MKSIQITALVLWMAIFIAISFFLGQFLASKEIFDITSLITGEKSTEKSEESEVKDEILANDVVINKIGQETVRIGQNIASDYFSEYYKDYINYIMNNINKYSQAEKVTIDDMLASDYVFYAVSRNIDIFKYESDDENGIVNIPEAEINSFVDNMFGKEIDENLKKDGKYGYSKTTKKYSIDKVREHEEYMQQLQKIENITSNEIVLTCSCKKTEGVKTLSKEIQTIELTCLYKGGRYIVESVKVL